MKKSKTKWGIKESHYCMDYEDLLEEEFDTFEEADAQALKYESSSDNGKFLDNGEFTMYIYRPVKLTKKFLKEFNKKQEKQWESIFWGL